MKLSSNGNKKYIRVKQKVLNKISNKLIWNIFNALLDSNNADEIREIIRIYEKAMIKIEINNCDFELLLKTLFGLVNIAYGIKNNENSAIININLVMAPYLVYFVMSNLYI